MKPLKSLIKSKNFYVGYEIAPKVKGQIYLNSNHFANFYTIGDDWPDAGKIAFNRVLAIDMGCPCIRPVSSLNKLLEILEQYLKDGIIKIK